jgi:hypothetical protein
MVRRNNNGAVRYHEFVIGRINTQFARGTGARLPRTRLCFDLRVFFARTGAQSA